MKTKKLKAWAILTKTSGKLEFDAVFSGGDCCCAGEPQALAVYDKKRTALECLYYKENFHIVPVTIMYSVPIIKRKKK